MGFIHLMDSLLHTQCPAGTILTQEWAQRRFIHPMDSLLCAQCPIGTLQDPFTAQFLAPCTAPSCPEECAQVGLIHSTDSLLHAQCPIGISQP